MNDLELAKVMESGLDGSDYISYVLNDAEWKQIIAALRRVPERPPSGEMVMVPRSFAHVLACRLETDALIGDERSLAKKLRAALSAAEAEGQK